MKTRNIIPALFFLLPVFALAQKEKEKIMESLHGSMSSVHLGYLAQFEKIALVMKRGVICKK